MRLVVNIAFFFLIFLVMYGPRLRVLDVATVTNVFVAIFALLCVDFKYIRNELISFCMYSFVLGLIFIVQGVWFVSQDNTAPVIMFKYCMYAISAAAVVILGYEVYRERMLSAVVRCIALASAIDCAFVIFFFVAPDIAFAASFILDYEEQANWIESGHRAFDISIGGGAVASFVFSSVLFVYLVVALEHNFRKVEVAGVSLLLLIGIVITGRTGIFILLIQLSLYAFFSVKAISVRLIVEIFLFLIFFLVAIFFVKDYWTAFEVWFDWYFEWVHNYMRYGEASSGSTDVIRNMYFFPEDVKGLLLGEANFGRNPAMQYVPSDVGYVRAIFGVGLLGAAAIYFVYFYPFFSNSYRYVKYNRKILLALFSLGFIVFNFKEMYLAGRSGTQLFFLIFFSVILSSLIEYESEWKMRLCNARTR